MIDQAKGNYEPSRQRLFSSDGKVINLRPFQNHMKDADRACNAKVKGTSFYVSPAKHERGKYFEGTKT